MQIKIDNAGRIVLPTAVRDKLQLSPGDSLKLEEQGNGVTLSPMIERPPARKKHGTWVFRTGQPLSTETVRRTLERVRDECGTHEPAVVDE